MSGGIQTSAKNGLQSLDQSLMNLLMEWEITKEEVQKRTIDKCRFDLIGIRSSSGEEKNISSSPIRDNPTTSYKYDGTSGSS